MPKCERLMKFMRGINVREEIISRKATYEETYELIYLTKGNPIRAGDSVEIEVGR